MRFLLALAIAALASVALSPHADACTLADPNDPRAIDLHPTGMAPVNATFIQPFTLTDDVTWRADGVEVEMMVDDVLSDAVSGAGMSLRVLRAPADALHAGAVLACGNGACAYELVDADLDAPSQPVLERAEVRYYLDHEDDSSGCPSTGFLDTLHLAVDVTDTGSSTAFVWLAYFGASADDALVAKTPGRILPGARQLDIWLGSSADHQRSGVGFSQSDPYCFALAAMDGAGNIGPRSEPVCLDTDDPDDPLVEVIDHGDGCSVAGVAGQAPMPRALGVALVIASIGLALRRRTPRLTAAAPPPSSAAST